MPAIFPGLSPKLRAERAAEQDSCWIPHRRAHTNKSHCPCAGGCSDLVSPTPAWWFFICVFISIPHCLEFFHRLEKVCPSVIKFSDTLMNSHRKVDINWILNHILILCAYMAYFVRLRGTPLPTWHIIAFIEWELLTWHELSCLIVLLEIC